MQLRYANVLGIGISLIIGALFVATVFLNPTDGQSAIVDSQGEQVPVRSFGSSLIGASTEEINEYALQYTRMNYTVAGEPTVRLSKAITAEESVDMLLGVGNPINMPRQYHTVILEGDFVREATGLHEAESYRFIAYVFDLEAGIPTTIIDSSDGSALKHALGDPSLPDEINPSRSLPDPSVDAKPLPPEPMPEIDVPVPDKPIVGPGVVVIDPDETTP